MSRSFNKNNRQNTKSKTRSSSKSQTMGNKTFLAIILMIAESLLALLLKFDAPLQKRLRPLVERDLLVRISTYLPHYEFYAAFTEKGVLLDSYITEESVKDEPDVIISGSSINMIRLLATGDENIVRKLQFKGNSDDISALQNCVQNMGFQNVAQDLFKNIKELSPELARENQQALVKFEQEVSEQKTQIVSLNEALLVSQTSANKLKKQIRQLLLVVIALFVGLIAIIGYAVLY